MSDKSLWDEIKEAWDSYKKGKPDADKVPVGSGLAKNAKKKIKNRRQQIEDAVEKAESGDADNTESN
jgi:hypothetical protein